MRIFLKSLKQNFLYKRYIISGFSVLEMVIATALFIMISMMTVNLIFSLNKQNQINLAEKKLYDTLFIVLDDMSKSLREGYNYSTSTNASEYFIFSFISQELKKEEYIFAKDNNGRGYIEKKIYTDTSGSVLEKRITMTNSDINITDSKIDFKPGFDPTIPIIDDSIMRQPFVKIILKGNSVSKPEAKFDISTSISQRSKVNSI